MLDLLIGAVLGGAAEALAGAGIEKTPALAKRIQRTIDLVERQEPTVVEAAVRRAVDAASADLRQAYTDHLYDGDGNEAVPDMVALLDHPPFAEEVTRKLLYRGQPDFERLKQAYLDLPPAQRSQRWDALTLPLLDFFDAIERHLEMDADVGDLVQGMQQIATLTRIEAHTTLIADASQQIQRYQRRIAAAGEETAGGVQQLIRLSGQQIDSLREIAQLLEQIQDMRLASRIEGDAHADGDLVMGDKIVHPPSQPDPAALAAIRAYLNSLRRECNRLPLAEEVRQTDGQRRKRPQLSNVYVDLQVEVQPTLDQVCERLEVPEPERPALLANVKAWLAQDGDAAQGGRLQEMGLDDSKLLFSRRGQPGDELDEDHPLMAYAEDEAALRRALEKLTALEALAAHRHLVLLGDPGSGKSTFVNHLAYVCASRLLDGERDGPILPGLDEESLLPLRVVMRRWSARLKEGNTPGRELAYAALMQETGLERAALLERLDRPDTLVLFDGLDESPARRPDEEEGLDRRGLLVASVADFCAAHPHCRVLVTCRVKPYQRALYQLADLLDVTLAPLDDARIQRFVRRWYQEAARLEPEKAAKARKDEGRLLESLAQRDELRRMAGTPLLLTMLAAVNAWAGLPESRAELYDRCVEQLLWEWEKRKRAPANGEGAEAEAGLVSLLDLLHEAGLRRVDVERVLWQQTYQAHEQSGRARTEEGDSPPAELPVDDVRSALARIHGRGGAGWAWAERVVRLMAERGGLLVESEPGTFTFPHRTFQEYLAARWLLETDERTTKAAELAESDSWQEVVLLACGYLTYAGRYGDVQALIAEMSGGHGLASEADRRRLLVAGTAWLEFGPERAVGHVGADLQEQIPAKLTALMQERQVPPTERLEAGLLLADLDVDPPGLDDFVPISATDTLGYDFAMGRYPVTNKQFHRFVDAGGYHEDRPWWTEKAVRDIENWSFNEDWRNGPRYWNDSSFNHATQPVVGVSWYEAVAYCRWLTQRLRAAGTLDDSHEVRLPTEEEWAWVAMGAAKREYAWGDGFDAWRVNSAESDLGQTTPVHMYPDGATPETKIWDLCGNVWEWTNDDHETWGKALRGGSWYENYDQVQASARLRHLPDYGGYDLGFRCVVVPVDDSECGEDANG